MQIDKIEEVLESYITLEHLSNNNRYKIHRRIDSIYLYKNSGMYPCVMILAEDSLRVFYYNKLVMGPIYGDNRAIFTIDHINIKEIAALKNIEVYDNTEPDYLEFRFNREGEFIEFFRETSRYLKTKTCKIQ